MGFSQFAWAADILSDDPIQQLLGEDKHNNGVRDDFEELIAKCQRGWSKYLKIRSELP